MVEEIGVVAERRNLFTPESMISLRTDTEQFFPCLQKRALAPDCQRCRLPTLT